MNCKNVKCRDETHVKDLNVFYESLSGSLTSAGFQAFSDTSRAKKFKCRPGWSEYVDELHKVERESFVMWWEAGKPKPGQIFELLLKHKAL